MANDEVTLDLESGVVQVTDAEGVIHTIREPERCIVVRTVASVERAYCTVERGSRVEEEIRVNGQVPDDAEDVLAAFASIVALRVAEEAKQRAIQVVRVANIDAGKQTAAALREAGFCVIEFSE